MGSYAPTTRLCLMTDRVLQHFGLRGLFALYSTVSATERFSVMVLGFESPFRLFTLFACPLGFHCGPLEGFTVALGDD